MTSATATAPPPPITALDGVVQTMPTEALGQPPGALASATPGGTAALIGGGGATAPCSSGGEHGGAWLDTPNVIRALAHVAPGGAVAMTSSG
ncbi:UNVERIFIED_CONTAM: hypothetical protein K2H54_067790 [Gekko kuhli]